MSKKGFLGASRPWGQKRLKMFRKKGQKHVKTTFFFNFFQPFFHLFHLFFNPDPRGPQELFLYFLDFLGDFESEGPK